MSFLWHGLTDKGVQVPVQVDDLGRVVVSSPLEVGLTAWCSTATDGTIRNSFNIASVVVNPGEPSGYNYTFATAMPNTNYTVVVTGNLISDPDNNTVFKVLNMTTTGFLVAGLSTGGAGWIASPGAHGVLVTGP